jgi:cyclophilin family peptidyl-prolyl cis-trans isomerase
MVLVAIALVANIFTFALPAPGTIVRFTTSVGNVDVRLYDTATPNSVANFLNYTNANKYNGTFIHRVPQSPGGGTANFVVQGGGFLLNNSIWDAAGIVTSPPIADEFGISNTPGTLAFAKNAAGATSQWFFNVGNNSFLDAQNFTVFGRVLGNGMTIVNAINNLPSVNAAVAQNAPGEDFDEIPVRNLQQVLSQGDITANEAVMANVTVLNLSAGDFDRSGTVNSNDYSVWRNTFESTTHADADGNGNGRVDAADYVIWRKTLTPSGAGGNTNVPEPSSLSLAPFALTAICRRSRRR